MVGSVLVVGGGIGGMSAAVALARRGVAVVLIDADPQWRVSGAGISVTGISLRAFDDLGILDDVRARGYVGAGMRIRSVDGTLLMAAPVPDDPSPLQSSGGIMRPVLHDILSKAVRAAGVDVRLGVRVTALEQGAGDVGVALSDATAGRFDLVVGADGIHSEIRKRHFPSAPPPKFTGQGCWRVVAPRPAHLDCAEMYLGGPVKLGFNPVSATHMYMFALEHLPGNPWFEPEAQIPHLRRLLEPFGGDVPAVRDGLGPASQVNYRPLEWLLLPKPWFTGRVVLIGDAAHATTPHMASGAGIAAEDGLVLAEELTRDVPVEHALDAFVRRRFERARLVVENSVRIGEIEMAGGSQISANATLGDTIRRLQEAY